MYLPRSGTWLLAAALCLLTGCGPTSFLVTPIPRARDLVEYEVSRDSVWAWKKIALIDVDGVIMNDPPQTLLGAPGVKPLATFKAKLERAARDPAVQAIVVRINSPGGGVTASDIMHQELTRFREETGKPVIAALMDVAASGGYYLACAADAIYAQPTTTTGSIGVIMVLPNVAGTLARIGATVNIIKSGDMKDAGSPFRPMRAEDRALYQAMVDDMYQRFVQVVAAGREKLDEPAVRALADGRVYTARQALEKGLVDEIGGLPLAILAAQFHAGMISSGASAGEPAVVVAYAPAYSHKPNIYATGPGGAPQVNVINIDLPDWLSLDAPQFLYLWAPGW